MARRTATYEPAPVEDLGWRYRWLRRSTLIAEEPVRMSVRVTCERLSALPIDEQVAGVEECLASHGLLDHAEALIAHLQRNRARWRTQ